MRYLINKQIIFRPSVTFQITTKIAYFDIFYRFKYLNHFNDTNIYHTPTYNCASEHELQKQ